MVTVTNPTQASLRVERTVEIAAAVEIVYSALLEQLGPACEMHDGSPMPMKFEAWPGGRWFRDLGEGSGHWWGQVQVIKPPTLIEISGPLFMSYPAVSHLQYRLIEQGQVTMLQFQHQAIGQLAEKHCEGVRSGWEYQLQQIKACAEKAV